MAMRHTPVEVMETRSLLADIERQIRVQEGFIAGMRAGGRVTSSAVYVLKELHQSADRKREHIATLQGEYDA